jgi:hypothetical protein
MTGYTLNRTIAPSSASSYLARKPGSALLAVLLGSALACSNEPINRANGLDARPQATTSPPAIRGSDASLSAATDGPGNTAQHAPSAGSSAIEIGELSAELDGEGGQVKTTTGAVTLGFPPKALEDPTTITAEPTDDYPADSQVVPGAVVDFGPDGMRFGQPVEVSIAYDPRVLPNHISEATLRLYRAVDDGWELVDGSSVDTERHRVVGQLSGFSTYAARGECQPRCDGLCGPDNGCGQVCRCGDGYVCFDGKCQDPNTLEDPVGQVDPPQSGGGCGCAGSTLVPVGPECVPEPEVCDFRDNDCDYSIDEELDCSAYDPSTTAPLPGGLPCPDGCPEPKEPMCAGDTRVEFGPAVCTNLGYCRFRRQLLTFCPDACIDGECR